MANTTDQTLQSDEEDPLQDSRRSVTEEQWKNLLERVCREEDQVPDEEELDDGDDDLDDADSRVMASANPWLTSTPQRPTRISIASSAVGAATVNTETGTLATETDKELNELNKDLDATADNLTDLEIEFAEEFKNMQMGLSEVFADWNTSQQDLMTATSNHPPAGQLITDESIRSEFGISMRSADIGTSIRSIRQHSRRMNSLKRDMELSFKQLFQQESRRKQSMDAANIQAKRQSDASEVAQTTKQSDALYTEEGSNAKEEQPTKQQNEDTAEDKSTKQDEDAAEGRAIIVHDDTKLNFWFGRIWSAIETLLAKRRAHRLAKQLEAKQAREAEFRDRSTVKSFWRLFLSPAPSTPTNNKEDPSKNMKAEIID